MAAMIFTLLLLLAWVPVGSAQDGSGPAAILDEQTRRRRSEELTRIGRAQESSRLRLQQELRRFDRRLQAARRGVHRPDRLARRLDQIQQKETQRQSRLRESLDQPELGGARTGDVRQQQELTRLRHRQRSEAFLDRQAIRFQRRRLKSRGSR